MLTPIRDRIPVVTGASRGIGKGIGQVFGCHGAYVLVVARQEFGVTAETAAGDGEAGALACDVANPEAVRRMAQAAEQRYGGIDILCAKAGIYPAGPLSEMTPAQ